MFNAPMWALWLGFFGSFVAGFCLRFWAHARRFERRNELGIEQYNSYGDLMSSRAIEAMAGLVGNVLLAVGLGFVLLIVSRYLLLS